MFKMHIFYVLEPKQSDHNFQIIQQIKKKKQPSLPHLRHSDLKFQYCQSRVYNVIITALQLIHAFFIFPFLDRFVPVKPAAGPGEPIVIEPVSGNVTSIASDLQQQGLTDIIKSDSDTYAILHKLLQSTSGSGLVSGDHKLTLLQNDGKTTEVVVHKVIK